MSKTKHIFWALACFYFVGFNALNAQILRGRVQTDKGVFVFGAIIQLADNSAITQTDTLGFFNLKIQKLPAELIISHVGYHTSRFNLKTFESNRIYTLKENTQLSGVEIIAKKKDNYVSTLDPYLVEHVNSSELKKAPCCNLSESFETNGSVDVVYSDGLTGAKEIQLLGLRGIYTQLMVENRPDYYGLAAPFALEYIPGTWIENIDINKGIGSVKNGYQSITGQINTELEKPDKGKLLFVNLFSESTGRLEANAQSNWRINNKLSTGLLLHADRMTSFIDKNKDGFMDIPNKKQLNGLYRLVFNSEKIYAQINFQAIKEERENGMRPDSTKTRFPITASVNRYSIFGKLAYLGFQKPFNQLGSQWAATYHDLKSQYGRNQYNGTQRSFYGNIIYATIINNTNHKLNLGTSYQLDKYDEFLNDKNLSRTEGVVGGFSEYTFTHPKKGDLYNDWTIVGGARADYHNLYKLIFTPRINLKYNFSANHAVKLSAGRGTRVANPIAENIGYLATNRAINIASNLKPEDAWNIGLSYILPVKVNDYDGRLNIDIYRTQFINQVVVDMESNYKEIALYNLNGQSYANACLVMFTSELVDGLNFKAAYKYSDTRTTYQTVLKQMPLIAKHRGLVSLDYHFGNDKWLLNLTAQFVGQQRLIERQYLPPQLREGLSPYAPSYQIFNMSLNKKFKTFECYGGIENLSDYVQEHPIIAADNPQSAYFDATQIYAPLMGRRFYLGIRFWINQ